MSHQKLPPLNHRTWELLATMDEDALPRFEKLRHGMRDDGEGIVAKPVRVRAKFHRPRFC